MKNAEALEQFRSLQRSVRLLADTYSRMHDPGAPGRVRASCLEEFRTSNEPMYAAIQQLEVVEKELHYYERAYVEAQEIFNRVIGEVENPMLKCILIDYYALGMTDEKIADSLGMCTKSVNNRRNAYMRRLKEGDVEKKTPYRPTWEVMA